MKEKRIHDIENYIYEKETVSLVDLAETFDVSLNTIRRDINYLEQSGVLKKVYGGVVSNQNKELTSFDYRETKNEIEKNQIAEMAAQLIEPNDIIFIDSGTTTGKIINHIQPNMPLTILTSNVDIVIGALDLPEVEVLLTGQRLNSPTRSFLNDNSVLSSNMEVSNGLSIFSNYNITKSFMASSGVSIQSGVTHSEYRELTTKKYFTERAAHTYLLVDDSKFGKASIITYADLNAIDTIVTNEKPSDEYVESFEMNNVKMITPQNIRKILT